MTWNPPRDDGGSKITNYVLERRATDSEVWHKLSSTIKETNFKATNLTPLKEYIFRVSAENMYGVGEPAQSNSIIAKYSFGKFIHLIGKATCHSMTALWKQLEIILVWQLFHMVRYFIGTTTLHRSATPVLYEAALLPVVWR